jgi:ABC-2 type transport system permease protein
MNLRAVSAIYRFELARTRQTLLQNVIAPVVLTSLYFAVFGTVLGPKVAPIDGVSYGAFIVPGLTMLSVLSQSLGSAAMGIYFPRLSGAIYEILSAPVSALEAIVGYVGAATTKSMAVALLVMATARLFIPFEVTHPLAMLFFLALASVSFAALGLVIGIWSSSFQQIQFVPALVVTPLAFLGGSFYSLATLPPTWQKLSLFNPVAYLVSGLRWSYYDLADVDVKASIAIGLLLFASCVAVIVWMFNTGYRLRH